jgi:hypothetical protein
MSPFTLNIDVNRGKFLVDLPVKRDTSLFIGYNTGRITKQNYKWLQTQISVILLELKDSIITTNISVTQDLQK